MPQSVGFCFVPIDHNSRQTASIKDSGANFIAGPSYGSVEPGNCTVRRKYIILFMPTNGYFSARTQINKGATFYLENQRRAIYSIRHV
jgi:hypothetical protein